MSRESASGFFYYYYLLYTILGESALGFLSTLHNLRSFCFGLFFIIYFTLSKEGFLWFVSIISFIQIREKYTQSELVSLTK